MTVVNGLFCLPATRHATASAPRHRYHYVTARYAGWHALLLVTPQVNVIIRETNMMMNTTLGLATGHGITLLNVGLRHVIVVGVRCVAENVAVDTLHYFITHVGCYGFIRDEVTMSWRRHVTLVCHVVGQGEERWSLSENAGRYYFRLILAKWLLAVVWLVGSFGNIDALLSSHIGERVGRKPVTLREHDERRRWRVTRRH